MDVHGRENALNNVLARIRRVVLQRKVSNPRYTKGYSISTQHGSVLQKV